MWLMAAGNGWIRAICPSICSSYGARSGRDECPRTPVRGCAGARNGARISQWPYNPTSWWF